MLLSVSLPPGDTSILSELSPAAMSLVGLIDATSNCGKTAVRDWARPGGEHIMQNTIKPTMNVNGETRDGSSRYLGNALDLRIPVINCLITTQRLGDMKYLHTFYIKYVSAGQKTSGCILKEPFLHARRVCKRFRRRAKSTGPEVRSSHETD